MLRLDLDAFHLYYSNGILNYKSFALRATSSMRNICLPTSSEFVMLLISNQIGNPIIIIIIISKFQVFCGLPTIWHFGQFLLISEHFLYILRFIVHADFWLLLCFLFFIIFFLNLYTILAYIRPLFDQHKPLTRNFAIFIGIFIRWLLYEFRLQKFFFLHSVFLFFFRA